MFSNSPKQKKCMTHLFSYKNVSFPHNTTVVTAASLWHFLSYRFSFLYISPGIVLLHLCSGWQRLQGHRLEQWRGGTKLHQPAWGTKRNRVRVLGKASAMYLGWQHECRKTSLQEEAPSSAGINTDFTYTQAVYQALQAHQILPSISLVNLSHCLKHIYSNLLF